MLWILSILAIADPAGTGETAEPPGARAEPDGSQSEDYTAIDAARDVGVILHDTSLEYVRARARLEAHPALATEALTDRLTGVPPPGPAQRKRIFDVLAALGGTDLVGLFAEELRRAAERDAHARNPLAGANPWRLLILQAGSVARPTLLTLVADHELPLALRGVLLQDVVSLSEGSDLVALVQLAGGSQQSLQRTLRRALRSRAQVDAEDRRGLLEATDQALAKASPEDQPALINLRVSLQEKPDPAFIRRMVALLEQPSLPFASQVSAVRALAASGDHPAARRMLSSLASDHLTPAHRTSQRSEVIGWLALSALEGQTARSIIQNHDLLHADSPRLAALAYERAPLPKSDWLTEGVANPWPEVRQAALGRIEAPCAEPALDILSTLAGPIPQGGDPDPAVARTAARGLARCGGPESFKRLRALLEDDRADTYRRSEAGRLLIEGHGNQGAIAVSEVLAATPPVSLARALIRNLRRGAPTNPDVKRALCAATTQSPRVAGPARDAMSAMYPDESC